MHKPFLTAAVLALCTAAVPAAAQDWRTAGFSTPESVAYDEANDRLIVSNIVGDAMQADGSGTLSLVGTDGTMIDADWVSGLDAPKGSAIAGDTLYVADLTRLRIVDLATGEYETVDVAGSSFLNDVAVDADGAVYITDTFANSIYRYADGAAELWVQDAALMTPNGLLVDGGTLHVASIGIFAENPADNKPGGMYEIDLATKAITKNETAGDFGALDGIVKIGEDLYISDFMGGGIYRLAPGGTPEKITTLAMGSADIGSDGTSIYVPMMMEGELVKVTP